MTYKHTTYLPMIDDNCILNFIIAIDFFSFEFLIIYYNTININHNDINDSTDQYNLKYNFLYVMKFSKYL